MKKIVKLTSLFLCFIVLVFSAEPVGAMGLYNMNNGQTAAEFYDRYLDFVVDNYKFGVTKEELLLASVKGFLKEHPEYFEELAKKSFDALDENSKFYNAEEFEEVSSDVSGIYAGIGMYVHQDGTEIILGEAMKGAPAEGSGLQVGDIVTAVNGEDVTGYALDKVTSLIKGEPGTYVNITVKRNGAFYSYDIVRALIKINPVTYNIIEGTDIGYVKIASFNATTSKAFDEAAKDLAESGVKKIVLDLRNNLGGYLTAAVNVASYFVPDKSLLVTVEQKDAENNEYCYSKKTDAKFKAVILINEYSASASEVVSSALRDYKTGTIVGRRSYGKGTVQTTIPIRSGHYLWMTTAEYFTPSHTEIHGIGLQPDYNLSNSSEYFDMSQVTKYDILRVLKVGDTGSDVYAVKERLKALGYPVDVNDVYDQSTADVVTRFQTSSGLYPYGVADLTTQVKINDTLSNKKVEVDRQLEKAIEVAKGQK